MTKPHLSQNYLTLPNCFYSHVSPEPMQNSQLVSVNQLLKDKLNINLSDESLLDLCSGQLQTFNCQPIAQKYTGHQFGYYNPQLGDGRGLLLGQWIDQTNTAWDFHLKGAGRTPYSRSGDGRAVLRSTIREYLASEALAGLGVPTTRALALATSTEQVRREIMEPRATLLRVTQSHIRFGHFQYAASVGPDELEVLINFVINKHFPQWANLTYIEQAQNLLNDICIKTAKMIAKWQAIGFNHGVMNTDNFSILGETFDYGPFAFFDDFNSDYICNHSDTEGRYAYDQQAKIGVWNCQVLAGSFADILEEEEINTALNHYVITYNQHYISEMLLKLGINSLQENDKDLIGDLVGLLNKYQLDYHQFFRLLGQVNNEQSDLYNMLPTPGDFKSWFENLNERVKQEEGSFTDWQQRILDNNPSIVLRNYIAQMIIEQAEKGNFDPLNEWLTALQSPFKEHQHLHQYQQAPSLTNKGLSLSCSS